ncbi:MAG: hypothetical protein QME96_04765 [Myxococcota bacterium]|nr:hypothetical protein [Myxococcota bacterium]
MPRSAHLSGISEGSYPDPARSLRHTSRRRPTWSHLFPGGHTPAQPPEGCHRGSARPKNLRLFATHHPTTTPNDSAALSASSAVAEAASSANAMGSMVELLGRPNASSTRAVTSSTAM